jgi:tryptophan halogenase
MIKKIVIVGGGFAGWYTAATLQHNTSCEILLIDSDQHPTIGVGETTGWGIAGDFYNLAGITNEKEFMRKTGAIYKHGVRAVDFFQDYQTHQWGKFPNLKVSSLTNFYNQFVNVDFDEPGSHRDGDIGMIMAWLKINQGRNKTYDDFVNEVGEHEYFISNPVMPFDQNDCRVTHPMMGIAYNFDAIKTNDYLKTLVSKRNTGSFTWITNTVEQVKLTDDGKNVSYLLLEDGTKVMADLFIDASGLKRVLMSSQQNNSWKDSGDQYCNAAWVVPSQYTNPEQEMLGISEFFGEDWGWRFKVRLYHRIGNGYVFNTNMVDPAEPLKRLLEITEGTRFVEPKLITWQPGEYTQPWQGNLLPLGMSGWMIDPYDAPTVGEHTESLKDLLKIILEDIPYPQQYYNKVRSLTREERHLRLDLTFGFSKRRGPFWDSRREMAQQGNFINKIKDIILGKRTDLEKRMSWHWHHMYVRTCLATGVDMSDWEFPEISAADQTIAEAFFAFNRARNKYINSQKWPNFLDWTKKNIFNNLTSQEILKELNPQFVKER